MCLKLYLLVVIQNTKTDGITIINHLSQVLCIYWLSFGTTDWADNSKYMQKKEQLQFSHPSLVCLYHWIESHHKINSADKIFIVSRAWNRCY